jgi:hypothetical protein
MLYSNSARDMHVFTYPSGLMGEGDRMPKLKIFATLGGTLQIFKLW